MTNPTPTPEERAAAIATAVRQGWTLHDKASDCHRRWYDLERKFGGVVPETRRALGEWMVAGGNFERWLTDTVAALYDARAEVARLRNDVIEEREAAARAEEREECATVADAEADRIRGHASDDTQEFDYREAVVAEYIAGAIRARGENDE